MAFQPYKRPALNRSNARKGCLECDITHEPFSCSDGWVDRTSFTENCHGGSEDEEIDAETDEKLFDLYEEERKYLFSVMDEWYATRREEKAAKNLVTMSVEKK